MLKLFYTLDAIHEIKMLNISWHCPFQPSQVLCNCPIHCTVYILLFQRAVWPDVGPAAQAGGWQGCGGGRVSLAGPPRHPQPWPQGWYPQVWRSARPWPRRPHRGPLCHWGRCVCEHRRRRREKRRQRSSLLFGGRSWMPHYSHLAERMIWRKFSGRKSILGGWWFGVVWTGRSSICRSIHFAECPFFYSSISSNPPGTKSIVRQGIKYSNFSPH